MSPIDRKVRKRAKAEAEAEAKAMSSRSNQLENPAFRALVDKLRGTKLGEPNISLFEDCILVSVTPIYDVADFHKSNAFGGGIDEYGDVNMVHKIADFPDDDMMSIWSLFFKTVDFPESSSDDDNLKFASVMC